MGIFSVVDCQNFYSELTDYEKKGINISMEGIPASPMQIVNAHMVKENVTYMRDYELNEDGDIEKLDFHNIKPK